MSRKSASLCCFGWQELANIRDGIFMTNEAEKIKPFVKHFQTELKINHLAISGNESRESYQCKNSNISKIKFTVLLRLMHTQHNFFCLISATYGFSPLYWTISVLFLVTCQQQMYSKPHILQSFILLMNRQRATA